MEIENEKFSVRIDFKVGSPATWVLNPNSLCSKTGEKGTHRCDRDVSINASKNEKPDIVWKVHLTCEKVRLYCFNLTNLVFVGSPSAEACINAIGNCAPFSI